MSRRKRAFAFASLAVLCGVASASIASGYRDSVQRQMGEMGEAMVLTAPLRSGVKLTPKVMNAAAESRAVPTRFLPPDAISDSTSIRGRRLASSVPGGSYLLASHLQQPGGERGPAQRMGRGRTPMDIVVVGAGALAGHRGGSPHVDVVVASEPITGGPARVRIVAEDVQLLGLEPAAPEEAAEVGFDAWRATLALTRGEALQLIEAENFARQIRLIAASRGG